MGGKHRQTSSFRKWENSFVCPQMEEGLDKTEGGVVISVPQTHKYTHNYKPNVYNCSCSLHSKHTELHAVSNRMRCSLVQGCIVKKKEESS